MVEIIRKRELSGREEKEIREVGQQPLDRSGYTNPQFDRYGTKNPYDETDRNYRKRRRWITVTKQFK